MYVPTVPQFTQLPVLLRKDDCVGSPPAFMQQSGNVTPGDGHGLLQLGEPK